ncbi:MAG: HRDC domain-containing protein [Candidatus Sericytochromatia bacterium]
MTMTTQTRTVLSAVRHHPKLMSPVLLDHLLRGEVIGRMAEKGLLDSPHFGALKSLPVGAAYHLIEACMESGWLVRGTGFYPALQLTHTGEDLLMAGQTLEAEHVSPEENYQAYYRWRQGYARERRTPPYRIFPNATVNELAKRRPVTLEELLMVPGLGKRRALRYQNELLAVGAALKQAQDARLTTV